MNASRITETFITSGDGEFHFTTLATLVRRAPSVAPQDASWKDKADQWSIKVHEETYGNSLTLDFWTGIGHRHFPSTGKGATDASVTVEPSAASVLSCLASEVSMALELPDDDADALNAYADEFGSGDEKPGDVLKIVRGLREARGKVEKLLRNTGIGVSEWLDWASELNA